MRAAGVLSLSRPTVSLPESVLGRPRGRILCFAILCAVSLLGARRHIDNMGPKFNILFLKRDVEDVPYLLIKSVNFCNGSR